MAGSVSGPNVLSALGNIESGQITLAEDEVDNLDNEHDKMTIWKMGYCQTGSRVPKTDLNAGRKQNLYYTYCFKICASERSLDNAKARGLLDRCFIIPCIAGRPAHNIKRVRENTKKNKHLMNEIEKTRKLLFAIRMVHYDDVIEEIGLNLFNREAELTEPTLRLFQYSPNTLKELQPALMKCLNNKREVKSNSLEAILYAVINNLIPKITAINDTYIDLSNDAIKEELKRISDGTDIPNKDAFRSKELGEDITWSKIWQILKDKFRACTITIGTGDTKQRGRRFTKKDLKSKSIDYDVPDEIKIGPINDIPHGPDNFDSLVNNHENGTPGTHHESVDEGKNERAGTPGTPGTPSGGNSEDIDAPVASDTERENKTAYRENMQKTGLIPPKGVPGVPSVPPSTKPTDEEKDRVFHVSQEVGKLEQYGIIDQIQSPRLTYPDRTSTPANEEPKLHDLPMPEELEDDSDTVSEKEFEPIQEPSKPITPGEVEDFFSNDIPLGGHSIEQSPCAAIIGSKPGEIPTDTVYCCKLCPDMIPSIFLQAVENHCRDKEPDVHKAEILRIIGGE